MEISLGSYHSCALLNDSSIKCWGDNYYGQLGDGTKNDRNIPVGIYGISGGVMHINAVEYYTFVLLTNSNVKCWGQNDYGQIRDGSKDKKLTPIDTKLCSP